MASIRRRQENGNPLASAGLPSVFENKPNAQLAESDEELFLMRKIDEIYTKLPFYGSPRITKELHQQGIAVNHKAIERLLKSIIKNHLIIANWLFKEWGKV